MPKRRFATAAGSARWCLALCLGLAAPAGQRAAAEFMTKSFLLDQTNNDSTLKDGTAYGTVTVTADPATGKVTVAFTVTPSKVPGPLGNFGLQEAALNTDLNLTALHAAVSADHGWGASYTVDKKGEPSSQLGGFGSFSIDAAGKGSNRQTTETITITGLGADATLGHFTIGSLDKNGRTPAQGSVFFAAHEAGFGGPQSMYVGGRNPVTAAPEPPGIVLGLSAVFLGLVALRLYRGRLARAC
jgi:hypothetical protein